MGTEKIRQALNKGKEMLRQVGHEAQSEIDALSLEQASCQEEIDGWVNASQRPFRTGLRIWQLKRKIARLEKAKAKHQPYLSFSKNCLKAIEELDWVEASKLLNWFIPTQKNSGYSLSLGVVVDSFYYQPATKLLEAVISLYGHQSRLD